MAYGTGVLLLSVVAGYWVLERAETHKGDLRRVGKFLGWVIIVSSLAGFACNVWSLASGKAYSCQRGGASCPFASKATLPPSQSK